MNPISFIKKEWPTISTIGGGFASAVTAFLQNKGGVKESVMGGGGLLIAGAMAIAHKRASGRIDEANIYAAGNEVAEKLPLIEADIASVISFVRTEMPGLTPKITELLGRISGIESTMTNRPITDVPAVTAVVHQVLAAAAVTASQPAAASAAQEAVAQVGSTGITPAPLAS